MTDRLDFVNPDTRRAFTLGTILGAAVQAKKSPGTILDPYGDVAVHLTPEQLAALDRALTPAEQALVDAWQESQANAAQKHEESTPYTDPKTGQKRVALATFAPGPTPAPQPKQPPQQLASEGFFSRKVGGVPVWGWAAIGAGTITFLALIAALVRR